MIAARCTRAGDHLRFAGRRRFDFTLDRPARLSLVHEPPGLAPLGGVAVMAVVFAGAGAVSREARWSRRWASRRCCSGGHAAAARWVRLEQSDEDGGTTVAYLTAPPAGGRYTSAPRELLAALRAPRRLAGARAVSHALHH